MKIIKPTDVTTAMLASSTASEDDYAEYNPSATYAVDARCISSITHRIYQSIVNDNVGNDPTLPGSAQEWMDVGPTNRWAMFDNVVGTVTSVAAQLIIELNPGPVSGIALMEIVGETAVISMKSAPGGTVVYSKTIDLEGSLVTSVYDWFFQPLEQRRNVIFTDLPWHYFAPELTISISSSSSGVECGVCKLGEVIEIGSSEYGATSGIIDYSIKRKDDFGAYTFLERGYSKRATFHIETDAVDYPRISRALASLRVIPCVYIGTELAHYEPLVIYGKYNDFSINVAYATTNYCSLDIEGLI